MRHPVSVSGGVGIFYDPDTDSFDTVGGDPSVRHFTQDHNNGRNHEKIDQLTRHVERLIKKVNHMSATLDVLTASVKANTDAVESAVILINGIQDRITAAGVDPVKLKALTDELDVEDQKLAAAVLANTGLGTGGNAQPPPPNPDPLDPRDPRDPLNPGPAAFRNRP